MTAFRVWVDGEEKQTREGASADAVRDEVEAANPGASWILVRSVDGSRHAIGGLESKEPGAP